MNESNDNNEVTAWLDQLAAGHSGALDELVPLIYREMRQLARKRLRAERANHTLTTTGLVGEAYLRFCQQRQIKTENRAEFFAFASECMRRILVDHARAHRAVKRGGPVPDLPLGDMEMCLSDSQALEIDNIDLALDRLESEFPRGCQVIKYRIFGGLNLEETADALGVSSKTIQRDWTIAIAWLRKEIGPTSAIVAA